MPTAVAIAIILTGAIKIGDFAAASAFVYREHLRSGSGSADATQVDFDWTPVFAWARSKRKRWKAEGKEGSARDLLLSIVIDGLFRAPVLTMLQALALLMVVGGTDGYLPPNGSACVFPMASSSVPPWLLLTAGGICVAVAASGIMSLLVLMLMAPRGNLEVAAGQYLWRSRSAAEERRSFGSILVGPAVTIALFFSFASLYLVLFAADRSAFAVSHCQVDAITMLYFSTSVGATVGFGDIVAVSDAARLIVVCEVLFVVTLLALFLQTLRRPLSKP